VTDCQRLRSAKRNTPAVAERCTFALGTYAPANGDEETDKPEMNRLANHRFYDLRHQFVTELCAVGIPEAAIRELAAT
jgi:hypothetical protein